MPSSQTFAGWRSEFNRLGCETSSTAPMQVPMAKHMAAS